MPPDMAEDTRHAGAAFAFAGAEDGGGGSGQTGNAEAVIGDDALWPDLQRRPTRSRVIHNDNWADALGKALA